MDLLNFRDQYISRLSSRLSEINLATAADAELLVAGALLKQLDAANRVDLLSIDALALLTTLSGADLDAYAIDPAGRVQVQAILADARTVTAISMSAAAMANIAGSSQWLQLLQQDAAAVALVVASAIAMDALSASAIARAVIGSSGALFTAISTSPMASGKYLAGVAGLSPSNYATVSTLAASVSGMSSVGASTGARSLIGFSGAIYDALKSSAVATAKVLAGHAGLDPFAYADMSALAFNGAAVDAVIANNNAMTFAKNSPACMAGLLSYYTARSKLWASSSARATLVDNAFSRSQLLANATTLTSYQASSSTLLAKRGWLLSVYPWPGNTSGAANFRFINNDGEANNATNSSCSTVFTGAAQDYLGSYYAKCSTLQVDNTLSPTPYATYTYLQMEP